MFYLIEETLKEVSREELTASKKQYVAVLSFDEWKQYSDSFDLGIEMDPDLSEIFTTKAEVNYDSLTGSFSIPDRNDFSNDDSKFAFVLDEKGIVFIDDEGKAGEIVKNVQSIKKWKLPSLERFIYDFLDVIVKDDIRLMEKYERELKNMPLQKDKYFKPSVIPPGDTRGD